MTVYYLLLANFIVDIFIVIIYSYLHIYYEIDVVQNMQKFGLDNNKAK